MNMSRLQRRLHVLIYPAPSVPGQWVSHCLDMDIVSQGNDAAHALEMICEAITLNVEWAIEDGRPAFELRPAPSEDWDRFERSRSNVTRILHLPSVPSDIIVEPVVSDAAAG